jgi:DNA-binding NarL/FixJ family response regulator
MTIAMKEKRVFPGRRVRILIADDQAHVRKGLQVVLELEEDFEVVGTAANGVEAVELAERLNPDVILMDLSMPYLDGLEATRCIRDRKLPGLVFLLITPSVSMPQWQVEQAQVAAVIDKGTPDAGLSQAIRSAMLSEFQSGRTAP